MEKPKIKTNKDMPIKEFLIYYKILNKTIILYIITASALTIIILLIVRYFLI